MNGGLDYSAPPVTTPAPAVEGAAAPSPPSADAAEDSSRGGFTDKFAAAAKHKVLSNIPGYSEYHNAQHKLHHAQQVVSPQYHVQHAQHQLSPSAQAHKLKSKLENKVISKILH